MALDPLGKACLGKIGGLLGKGQQQQILHRPSHQGERRRLEQIGQVQGVVVGAPTEADHALALGVEQIVPHQLVDKGEQLGVLGDEAVAAVVEAILTVVSLEGLGGAHAAHHALLLEQGDRKTGLAQAPGGHQTGRAGAQYRYVLCVVVAHHSVIRNADQKRRSGKGGPAEPPCHPLLRRAGQSALGTIVAMPDGDEDHQVAGPGQQLQAGW